MLENNSQLLEGTKLFLEYVLIYDFMSFTSSRLHHILSQNMSSDSTFVKERSARTQLLSELFAADNDICIDTPIYEAFRAIILAIQPAAVSFVSNVQPSVLSLELEPAVLEYESQSTPIRSMSSARTQRSITPNHRLRRTLLTMSPSTSEGMNVLILHHINKVTTHSGSKIYDTGATKSGTGNVNNLKDVIACSNISVQGPFGKPFQPTLRGTLHDLNLDCVVIPGMKETLISVSEACRQGFTFIFDSHGCHGFKTDSIIAALENIKSCGQEVARGVLRNGLYCSIPVPHKNLTITSTVTINSITPDTMLYVDARPASKYEHVHESLGHPGTSGMLWHKNNTPGADFTDEDANTPRGLCSGCVLGGMRQGSTDHRRDHRPSPSLPGQQFSLDAFSCTTPSRANHNYCDIFTDICTSIRYPVFTKTRTALELCERTSILFDLHPEWTTGDALRSINLCIDNTSDPPDPRFIRLDAESNYRSSEFLHCMANYKYRLERTPPRDKHANGIAERSVGLVTLKTNVAMQTPQPPVPPCFWDLAMEYACQTLSFCYNSKLKTSPYYFLHKVHIPFKFLQPFWTPCYVYLGQKN